MPKTHFYLNHLPIVSSIILVIIILIIGCKQGDSLKTKEQNRQDSITTFNEKKRLDSIRVEEEKVIGEIKFGMGEKQTKNLWQKFLKENRKPNEFLKGYYDYYIGDYEIVEGSMSLANSLPRFRNDSLYYFTIVGQLFSYNEYVVKAPKVLNAISDILTNKFGNPQFEIELPNWYNTDRNYYYVIKYWIIGKKKIEIKLNPSWDTMYSIDVSIYLPEIVDQEKIKEEQEADQKARTGKDVF